MPESIPAPNSSSFENKKNTNKWGNPKKYKAGIFLTLYCNQVANFFDTYNLIFETDFKPVDFYI